MKVTLQTHAPKISTRRDGELSAESSIGRPRNKDLISLSGIFSTFSYNVAHLLMVVSLLHLVVRSHQTNFWTIVKFLNSCYAIFLTLSFSNG